MTSHASEREPTVTAVVRQSRRLIWRDVGVPWPYPLKTDRGEAADADSVGVAVRKQEQQGSLVIFRGGWADLEYQTGRHFAGRSW
jgi:hypothetical protein